MTLLHSPHRLLYQSVEDCPHSQGYKSQLVVIFLMKISTQQPSLICLLYLKMNQIANKYKIVTCF